jgi:hypothetical protein
MKYTGYVYQPTDGTTGGILVAWSEKDLDVSEIHKNKHSLTVYVRSTSDETAFTVTNVYAPCDASRRLLFFDDMKSLQHNVSGPWVLAGDLNIYRYAHEKNNNNISWTDMENFIDWINQMELMDIEICNSKYTWSNMRRDPTLVKLERVIVNIQWGQKFLHSACRTLGRPTSDHKPLLLDNDIPLNKSKIFRYDDHWFACTDLVQITRNILIKGTREMAPVSKLNFRLRSIRAATRQWTRKKKSLMTIL